MFHLEPTYRRMRGSISCGRAALLVDRWREGHGKAEKKARQHLLCPCIYPSVASMAAQQVTAPSNRIGPHDQWRVNEQIGYHVVRTYLPSLPITWFLFSSDCTPKAYMILCSTGSCPVLSPHRVLHDTLVPIRCAWPFAAHAQFVYSLSVSVQAEVL